MTLMIALIGEQALPNLLPIRHYQPDAVLLVYTSRTEAVSNRLQALLSKDATVHMLETDAYDIRAISLALGTELEKLKAASLLFNLTGGTKSMVLAAYQVAQNYKAPVFYFQSEGKRSKIYYYVWESQQLVVQSQEWLPAYLTLTDFFDVQLGREKWYVSKPGNPFEPAIADVLKSHGYEVMCVVSAFKEQIDIDVAIRYGNQVGIIEAKTGGKARSLEGVKQLITAVKHLGTYTRQFYVINVLPSQSHETLMLASSIQVISLPEYLSGMTSLTIADAEKLVAAIDNVMKD